ncbi:hypothetical protein [Ochrobactrum sp. AN78]|uniref:hypothetical protein n=1 Tax=Ochrobactrum sp. AN78 TaxID=3039853 RepID=UPI0029899FF5|nr:hypothetical protein [Ochrobactrum sp. AN78]MDH7789148.1 hypothetical protein [Ochrobactrum sp. AN78]
MPVLICDKGWVSRQYYALVADAFMRVTSGTKMFIDSSEILSQNDKILRASEWGMENVEFANKAIDVLRSASYLPLDDADDITLLRLAIRLINSAGAAGISSMNGYYQPAASNIRDIIEVAFLLDLFSRDLSQIEKWRTADKKTLFSEFRPLSIRQKLDKFDNPEGGELSFRNDAYKLYSEHGTHMKANAVILMSPNMNTIVGPFPDAERLLGLSFDIARYLGAGTFYLFRCLNREMENTDQLEAFVSFSRIFLDALKQFKARTTKPDL